MQAITVLLVVMTKGDDEELDTDQAVRGFLNGFLIILSRKFNNSVFLFSLSGKTQINQIIRVDVATCAVAQFSIHVVKVQLWIQIVQIRLLRSEEKMLFT